MKKRTSKIVFDITAIVFVLIGTIILIQEFCIKPKQLHGSETVRFSVATITGFDSPSDGGEDVSYIYTINQRTYKGFFNAFKRKIHVGEMYFLQFSIENPNNATIMLGHPVPESIKDIPSDGWEKLPY